jgi:hypothetical protein
MDREDVSVDKGAGGGELEVGRQRSEVRGQRTEVGKSEIRSQRSEDRDQRSEVRSKKLRRSEDKKVGRRDSEK